MKKKNELNEQKGHSTELGFVTNVIGYDSRYTFSAKEKDDETQYSYFGARYYDSDLSIFLSIDRYADKYPNLSPYQYCAWNPVKNIDPTGDTIRVTDQLKNNADAFEAYNKFMSSKAGQKIQKQYGEGGKNYNVSVVFGVQDDESAAGDTKLYLVNGNSERQANIGETASSGEFWRFKINIAPLEVGDTKNSFHPYGANGAGNAANEKTGMDKAIHRAKNIFRMSETYLHESQHLRIMTNDIMRYGCWKTHPYYQHDMMKNKMGEYYRERWEFYLQYQTLFKIGEYDPNSFEN